MNKCTAHQGVFVFGSNLAGRHGAGSAAHALRYHGAVYGNGVGPQGDAYAIPTKDAKLDTLPLHDIVSYVEEFLDYAEEHEDQTFYLVKIGCGLAGYSDEDIKPLFELAPPNVRKPEGW